MRDLLVMSGVGLLVAVPVVALLRRLFRRSWSGFAIGVALGWTLVAAIGAGLGFFATPAIEQSIVDCQARNGYDCDDEWLVLVILLMTAILVALEVLVLGLILRLAAGRRAT